MDASELLKHYAAGERDFSGVDLSDANLMRADLNEANLIEADLRGADLRGAELVEADLRGASLSGADLSDANLMRADLSVAELMRADLSVAELMRADLNEANLIEADLRGADLRGADLRGAKLIEADLFRANLSVAGLNGANLSGASLRGANLRGANLSGASLIRASLKEASLIKASLSEANLSGANLSNANLAQADLTNAKLHKTKIDGTLLAYQNISEELKQEKQENQELRERFLFLETQFENLVERQIEKRLIANQGIKAKKLTWQGMRFRSEPEREIAKVLDEMGVMFFPLPSGRVMTEEGMRTREVDFLICSRGIWGILECDGELWHLSAAKDHKRDNDFKRKGLWFIQRFTDKECKNSPHKVVRQFLDMLHKFHEDQCYAIIGNLPETEFSLSPSNLSVQAEES